MKKVIVFMALVLLAGGTAAAQGGEEIFPFLRIDRDPATASLAGAGTANVSSTAYSAFRNAALIPFSSRTLDAGFSYQRWSPDGAAASNLSGGAAWRLGGKAGVSVGIAGDRYDLTVDGTHPSDFVAGAGFGYRFTETLGVGLDARFARQKLAADFSRSGFCGDLFLLWQAMPELHVAAGVSSVGPKVDGWSLPASATLAGDYARSLGPGNLRVDLDADLYFSGNFAAALGAEYGYADLVFVRAGYRFATEKAVIPSHLALGLGVQLYGVRLDMAFLTASPVLGKTLSMGLGYSF